MIQTVFTTTETIVTAAMKMVSFAQEPWARQTELANPKLVFGEIQPARIIINSGLIRKIHGQIQLTSYNPTVFAMQN
jgi:hypothetical protein